MMAFITMSENFVLLIVMKFQESCSVFNLGEGISCFLGQHLG